MRNHTAWPICSQFLQWIGNLFLAAMCGLSITAHADDFIDYKPSVFTEHPSNGFFFSIGRKLKYANAISEDAPTVFEGLFEEKFFGGDLTRVYPSPNNRKAVVANKGKLYLVEPGKAAILLLEHVDDASGYSSKDGDTFFVHYELQWDVDSRFIYIPRTIKKTPKLELGVLPDEALVMNRALMRIDTTNTHEMQEAIPTVSFQSRYFFLLDNHSICFYRLSWRCAEAGKLRSVRVEENALSYGDGTYTAGKPFKTENINFYKTDVWLTSGGYYLTRDEGRQIVRLFHKKNPDKPILEVKGEFDSLKGHYHDGLTLTVMLPGNRYTFLRMWGRNLLVDSETSSYRELPNDTRVYVSLNSRDYENSFLLKRHNQEGTSFDPTFVPVYRLRTNYVL